MHMSIHLITILCYYLYSTECKIPEGFLSLAIDTKELNGNLQILEAADVTMLA